MPSHCHCASHGFVFSLVGQIPSLRAPNSPAAAPRAFRECASRFRLELPVLLQNRSEYNSRRSDLRDLRVTRSISSCGSSSLFSVPQRSTLVQAPRRSFRRFGAPMPNAPSAHRPTKMARSRTPRSRRQIASRRCRRTSPLGRTKKVCGESDEVAAAPPCVATAIARWRLRRNGISKQGGTCHGQRSG